MTSRKPNSDQRLGKFVQSQIESATGPKLSKDQARRAETDSTFLLPTARRASDASTVMQWTRRRAEMDLGTYIIPTPQYFKSQVLATQTTPLVETYAATNGNVGLEETLTAATYFTFSGAFELSRERTIRLTVRTAASLHIAIDSETVLATDTFGPNQHTDASITLAAGRHTIEIGFYQQSGRIKAEIGGDLARQVDKVLSAPDRTPPTAPNAPVLSIVEEAPALAVSGSVTPVVYDADRVGYWIWKAKTATASPPTFPAGFDRLRYLSEQGEVPNATLPFLDHAIEIGAFYHYVATATDLSDNESSGSPIATIEAVDSGTRPASVTGLQVNGVAAIVSGSGHEVETNQQTITWTDPTDADFTHVRIFMDTGGGKVQAKWDTASPLAEVPKGVQTFELITDFAPAAGVSETVWVFVQAVDSYGNVDVDQPSGDSSYSPGAKVEISIPLPEADGIRIVPTSGNEPNSRGWYKNAIPTFEAESVAMDVEVPANVSFWNWPQSHAADEYEYLLGTQFTPADWNDTGPEGEVISAKRQKFDNSPTGLGYLTVYIDTTAPTNPTGVTLLETESGPGLRLAWTDGIDAGSGLLETVIYRAKESTTFGDATEIARVPAGVEEYIDTDVEQSSRYSYWLQCIDRADNANASQAGPYTRTLSHPGSRDLVNWLDNSSFERGDDELGRWKAKSWEEIGTWSSGNWGTARPPSGFHGSRYPAITSTRGLAQRALPLLDAQFMITLHGRRVGSGTAGARARLVFKDVDGGVVQTTDFDFALFADSDTWTRATALLASGVPVFGPSGSDAPTTYPAGTHSVDVELLSHSNTVNVDGILLEEVYTDDTGTTWKSRETNQVAPSDWADSRVDFADRVIARIGRFGKVYANNIEAGKVQSQDGNTYLDLDNSELVLEHDNLSKTVIAPDRFETTLDNGSTHFDFMPVKIFEEELGTGNPALSYSDTFGASESMVIADGRQVYVETAEYIVLAVMLTDSNVLSTASSRRVEDGATGLSVADGYAIIETNDYDVTNRRVTVRGFVDWSHFSAADKIATKKIVIVVGTVRNATILD